MPTNTLMWCWWFLRCWLFIILFVLLFTLL
jgi:hypothetical protein